MPDEDVISTAEPAIFKVHLQVFTQGNWCPDQYSNQPPLEREARLLPLHKLLCLPVMPCGRTVIQGSFAGK
jgi:hypothetical protein